MGRPNFTLFAALAALVLSAGCNPDLRAGGSQQAAKSARIAAAGGGLVQADAAPIFPAFPAAERPVRTSAQEVQATAAQVTGALAQEAQAVPVPACSDLIPGPARGLACLHCMQPEAGDQPQVIIGLLLRSCLKNVAINYLVDGSFSYNEELLLRHIETLTAGGRRLFVVFYLSNGPKQRWWKTAADYSFGAKTRPEDFREQLFTDPALQAEYREIVTRLNPVIESASRRGAYVLLVPALEDNLSDSAFLQLYHLARSAAAPVSGLYFGRNACLNCYPGNEAAVPPDVFHEVHTVSPKLQLWSGVVSNDGIDYEWAEADAAREGTLTLAELAPVRDTAAARQSIFILWNGRMQGLPRTAGGRFEYVTPSKRLYYRPTPEEQDAIIAFLRG